jgi:hypothetical protein
LFFKDSINSSGYIGPKKWVINNEMQRIWNEMVPSKVEVLYRRSSGGIGRNHYKKKEPQPGQPLGMNYILYNAYWETRNAFGILVGKTKKKRPPGRHMPLTEYIATVDQGMKTRTGLHWFVM